MRRLWRLVLSYLRPQRGPFARPHSAQLHDVARRQILVKAELGLCDDEDDAARLAWVEAQAAVRRQKDAAHST